MKDVLKKVEDFHRAFELFNHKSPSVAVDSNLVELRHRLMQEENDEYLQAALEKDLVGIADALGDKLYILCGTIITHGMQHLIVDVFNEIHKSNMSKLDETGKPLYREDGKVIKSNRYLPPQLEKIVAEKSGQGE